MSALEIFFYLFGTIFFFSALVFAYYAFNNARLMQGALGHQLMALGGCMFVVGALVGAVDHFLLPGSGLVYAEFLIWIAGLLAIVSGGWLRGREVQRASRVPLARIIKAMPYAQIHLTGIAILLLVSLPLSLLSVLSPLRREPRWLNVANIVIWTFAFVMIAISERGLHLAVQPPAPAGVMIEEEILLRDDILALRVYADLINRLLRALVSVTGAGALRKVLSKCADDCALLKDCKITDEGALTVEEAVETLVGLSKKEGLSRVFDGFSNLTSQFIELYSAITSSKRTEEIVARSYRATKRKYRDLPVVSRILETIPEGFLEEEKLALLSKKELETKVKERTRELEETLLKAEEAIEAMQASRASFHNIVERSTDGIIVVDQEETVRFVNAAAVSFLDCRADELLGEPLGFPIELGKATELDITCGNGEEGIGELRVVETEWEGRSAYLALLRDITERKQAEEQIRASLGEKEILLKEIHHRVKNNLQIITGLLMLQSGATGDEKALAMLRESRNRIHSMAIVHETLYHSENLARVNFAEYVQKLIEHLLRSFDVNSQAINLAIDVDRVSLSIDAAIHCGMIVNELVSNALKYAFPPGRSGRILISLQPNDNGRLALVVSDDGIGLPPDVEFQRAESLGLRLVSMLADQLEGSIEVDRQEGTTFRIVFWQYRKSHPERTKGEHRT